MIPDSTGIVITCEHAGNLVPKRYRHLFNNHEELLNSHRGYDIGARSLARKISRRLDAPLFHAKYTRLLIETNRSISSRNLFSPVTRGLPRSDRRHIIDTFYHPYRRRVEEYIQQVSAKGPVIHLSIHTFTPVLGGAVRKADIGLLYDPGRPAEKAISSQLFTAFQQTNPLKLTCRRNYPYKGIADSFTTGLRKRYADDQYAGLEIEVNQKHCVAGAKSWNRIGRYVADIMHAIFIDR